MNTHQVTELINYGIGMVYLLNGRLEKAEIQFTELLAQNPFNGNAMIQLGMIRKNTGKIGDARDLFEKAIQYSPEDEVDLYHLGLAHVECGNQNEAEVCFTRFLKQHPDHTFALLNLGFVLGRMGNFDKAQQLIADAYRIDPMVADGFAQLGWIKAQMLDWSGALELMNEDLREKRVSPAWQINIALSHGQTDDFATAFDLIDEAYSRSDSVVDGYARLGWLKTDVKDWNGAFEVMILDREKHRLSAGWRHLLGLIQVFKGDSIGAEKSVEGWYSRDKSAVDGYAKLGWAHYLKSADKPTMHRFIEKDIGLNRLSCEGEMIVAWDTLLRGDLAAAGDLMDSLYAGNSVLEDGFAVMGWMQAEEGKPDEAIRLMETDHRLRRLSPVWQINYAYQLAKADQPQKAQALFDEAMRREPFIKEIRIGYPILPKEILTKDQFLKEIRSGYSATLSEE